MIIDDEDSFLDGQILRFESSAHVSRLMVNGEQTADPGSSAANPLHFERSTNHPGTVIHQVKTDPLISRSNVADPATVILDSQRSLMLNGSQPNDDLARVTVLDRDTACRQSA